MDKDITEASPPDLMTDPVNRFSIRDIMDNALKNEEGFKILKSREDKGNALRSNDNKSINEKIESSTQEKNSINGKGNLKEDVTESEPVQDTSEDQGNDDSIDPSDAKSQKTWEKYKNGYKLYQKQSKELNEYKDKIKNFESINSQFEKLKSDYDAREKQLEDLNKHLYTVKVESTPEWKKLITDPLNDTIEQAEIISTKNNINLDSMIDALYKSSKGDSSHLKEIYADLDDPEKMDLYSLSKNLIQINKRKDQLQKDSRAAYEAFETKQQQEQKDIIQKVSDIRDKAVIQIEEKFSNKSKDFLPDNHNINFQAISRDAKTIDHWKEEEKMYAGFAAAILPDMINNFKKVSEELKSAKKELSKFRNSSPKTTSGRSATSPSDIKQKTDLSKMSLDDFAKQSLARITGYAR